MIEVTEEQLLSYYRQVVKEVEDEYFGMLQVSWDENAPNRIIAYFECLNLFFQTAIHKSPENAVAGNAKIRKTLERISFRDSLFDTIKEDRLNIVSTGVEVIESVLEIAMGEKQTRF